jgi:NDP-sugar pyrophosphorylase family protein
VSTGGLKTGMILAAGFGTRLKPITDSVPKALIPYKGKPMICNVIQKLMSYGIERIVINTHHFSEQMEEFFAANSFDAEITLVHEEAILGTGGGIKNAEKDLRHENSFLVYNVDIDCEINLHELYNSFLSKNPLAALAVKKRQSSRYLLASTDLDLIGRTENGNEVMYKSHTGPFTTYAFCGIHILSCKVFEYLPSGLSFDIIPAYMQMLQKGINISAYDIGDTWWKDLGKPI